MYYKNKGSNSKQQTTKKATPTNIKLKNNPSVKQHVTKEQNKPTTSTINTIPDFKEQLINEDESTHVNNSDLFAYIDGNNNTRMIIENEKPLSKNFQTQSSEEINQVMNNEQLTPDLKEETLNGEIF